MKKKKFRKIPRKFQTDFEDIRRNFRKNVQKTSCGRRKNV